MQLVSFVSKGGVGWGVLVDWAGCLRVVDGVAVTGGRIAGVRQLLAASAVPTLAMSLRLQDAAPLEEFQLLAPIPDPGKVLAVGFNYSDHAAEAGAQAPAAPIFFSRFSDNLIGHEQPLIRPHISECLDFEGELAVVIGRTGRYVREEEAMSLVAGYACFNDGSMRDLQKESITAGKNFPATAPFGPWLTTAESVSRPDQLMLTTRLNGSVVQRSSTGRMVHGIASLVAYASRFTVLRPGDVLATGTPEGIGSRRIPPLWMKPGDEVEVEIDGLGLLRNPVVAEDRVLASTATTLSA